jgi:hypothetical protein
VAAPVRQRPAAPPPVPAPPAKTKPKKESRADRKRRLKAGGLPPPWSPPTPGPPPPPRRKRRRRKPLAVLTLLGMGAGVWYAGPALGLPYVGQYPVTADLPAQVFDLSLRDDEASVRTTDRLRQGMLDADLGGTLFAGAYRDDGGKRVTVFGSTGFRPMPQNAVEAEMGRLTAEYDVRDVQSYDLGETGVHERCGVGRSGDATVVVCTWADFGSVGSALLTRRSAQDSAQLVGRLRDAVLSRG